MTELVLVKDKFQVTLPAAMRKRTSIETGDYLEISNWGDGILLRPASGVPNKRKRPGIVAFLNEARDNGRSRKDIDGQVAEERASWD